jgi:hypothetical protein
VGESNAPTTIATTTTPTSPISSLIAVTVIAGRRRVSVPPQKSDVPQSALESNARKIAIGRSLKACTC